MNTSKKLTVKILFRKTTTIFNGYDYILSYSLKEYNIHFNWQFSFLYI